VKIAVPEHQGRISPVFDSSRQILVFEVDEERRIAEPHQEDWSTLDPLRRAARLHELEIDVLLCGGISAWLAEQILAQGIELVPWVAGEIEQVLEAHLNGRLPDPQMSMPGCCRRRWRGGRKAVGPWPPVLPPEGYAGGDGQPGANAVGPGGYRRRGKGKAMDSEQRMNWKTGRGRFHQR